MSQSSNGHRNWRPLAIPSPVSAAGVASLSGYSCLPPRLAGCRPSPYEARDPPSSRAFSPASRNLIDISHPPRTTADTSPPGRPPHSPTTPHRGQRRVASRLRPVRGLKPHQALAWRQRRQRKRLAHIRVAIDLAAAVAAVQTARHEQGPIRNGLTLGHASPSACRPFYRSSVPPQPSPNSSTCRPSRRRVCPARPRERSSYCLHVGRDHCCRDLRDDGIAVTAQSSHSGGYPMSQRLKAGLSWPGFPVSAGEPGEVVPRANITTSSRLL